jgi:hypothetical protein
MPLRIGYFQNEHKNKEPKSQRAKEPTNQQTNKPKTNKRFFLVFKDTVKIEAVAFTNMKSPHENHVHLTDLVIDYAREGLSSRADCSDSE